MKPLRATNFFPNVCFGARIYVEGGIKHDNEVVTKREIKIKS